MNVAVHTVMSVVLGGGVTLMNAAVYTVMSVQLVGFPLMNAVVHTVVSVVFGCLFYWVLP